MSYPDLPDNRLVVNNVDLTEKFKMVLGDGYTLEPPSIKTYVVDIPGGNGQLDLTESLMGDTAYGNRKQEFTFYLIDVKNYEKVKTQISNLLHGRLYNYSMTMDPGYTYHGRFSISSYQHGSYSYGGKVGVIVVSVDADPFKYLETQRKIVNAVGGGIFVFESGRKRVRPTIITSVPLKVIFDGTLIELPAGTWNIDSLVFELGDNEVYLNSYDVRNLTWNDLETDGVTWKQFSKKRLFEWYKSKGDMTIVKKKWRQVSTATWDNLSALCWGDLVYTQELQGIVDDVKVEYEWGDL